MLGASGDSTSPASRNPACSPGSFIHSFTTTFEAPPTYRPALGTVGKVSNNNLSSYSYAGCGEEVSLHKSQFINSVIIHRMPDTGPESGRKQMKFTPSGLTLK